MNSRVGFGYDVHRLDQAAIGLRDLVLGGVVFDGFAPVVANSDGDVVVHAVIDAILGGACMGDIGEWFAEDSDEYKGIDSLVLLKKIVTEVQAKGYRIINVDVTVVAQEPKLKDKKSDIRLKLSELLTADVNVKATSPERVGSLGNKEAIACFALANLSKA